MSPPPELVEDWHLQEEERKESTTPIFKALWGGNISGLIKLMDNSTV
jgi:hypothetical protein